MGDSVKLDSIDLGILDQLQQDATRPLEEVARQVGLSQSPCWRRIRRLSDAGLIRRRVALLDAERLGLGVTVFVSIRTDRHDAEWLSRFAEGVRDIPEVVEFYRMSGDVDYLLKVLVADIAEYDRVYKRLIGVAELHDVSSSFAMEQLKYTTALPLPEPTG